MRLASRARKASRMEIPQIALLVIAVLFVMAVLKARRNRGKEGGRRRGGVGTGAAGAIYDMLNEDKRRAIEIIAEQKAEERDPETADGNLPELESPRGKP
jgi:hypothetical protein